MRRLGVGLALAMACIGGSGCGGSGPVTLRLAYQASDDGQPVPHVPCRIRLAAVADGRPDNSRASLGDRGSGPVLAENIPQWVGQGLDTLVARGLAVWMDDRPTRRSTGATAPRAAVIAEVSIRRLYTRAVASDLEGVIVLGVRYTLRDGTAPQRDYRASAQKVNWFSAAGEVQEVLNRALEDVVHQIAGDLGAMCRSSAARPGRGGREL